MRELRAVKCPVALRTASEHTFDELVDAGCPIPGCDGFWEWPRMRCGTCGNCLLTWEGIKR